VVVALSILSLVWLAWQMVAIFKAAPVVARLPHAAPAARLMLRAYAGAGSMTLAAIGLYLWLTGTKPTEHLVSGFHILSALGQALLLAALLMAGLALLFFPPFDAVALAGGGVALAVSPAFVEALLASGLLAGLGLMLSQAADGSGGDSGDSGGSGEETDPDQARLDELARDPAHGGRITPGSMEEARTALELERSGKLPGPVQRDPSGAADFIDGNGQAWDVKSFHSEFPQAKGGFDLGKAMNTIRASVRGDEDVILNTSHLSADDLRALTDAIGRQPGLGGHVLFWP
jgi:hypothetical protein